MKGQARLDNKVGQARLYDRLGKARLDNKVGQARLNDRVGQAQLIMDTKSISPIQQTLIFVWGFPSGHQALQKVFSLR